MTDNENNNGKNDEKPPVEIDWKALVFRPSPPPVSLPPVKIDKEATEDEVDVEAVVSMEEIATINKRYEVLQKSSTQLPEDTFNYNLDNVIPPPYNLDQLVNLNEVSVMRNSCITAITTNTVGLGYRIRKDDPLEPLAKTDEISKKIRKLLEKWATRGGMTFTELMSAVKHDEESTGNGYIEVSRDRRGWIDGLYYIPSSTMRIRKNRDGFVQDRGFGKKPGFYNFGDKVKLLSDGRVEFLPDRDPKINEIIHFKINSSKSSYYGLPRDIAAIVTIAGDEMARNHNIKYFTHSATPDFFLVFEIDQAAIEKAHGNQPVNVEVPRETKDEVISHFRQNLASQTFIPGVFSLPAGVKLRLERVSQGQKDAGWTKYREENKNDIRLAHRVPASILGQSGSNYASSAIEKANFLEQVINPEQTRYEERLMGLLWPEMFMVGADPIPPHVDEEGQLSIPAQPKLSAGEEVIGVDSDIWKLEFVQLTALSEIEKAQVLNVFKQMGAINNDEVRDEIGMKPQTSPMDAAKQVAEPTPPAGGPDPNDIRGLQGLPGGGRKGNGEISIPALKRPNSDSIPEPANINTVGRPTSMAKSATDLPDLPELPPAHPELEDVLLASLEKGYSDVVAQLQAGDEQENPDS